MGGIAKRKRAKVYIEIDGIDYEKWKYVIGVYGWSISRRLKLLVEMDLSVIEKNLRKAVACGRGGILTDLAGREGSTGRVIGGGGGVKAAVELPNGEEEGS
jgi:hypothetical protein